MVSIRAQLIEELGFDPDEPAQELRRSSVARGSAVVATMLIADGSGNISWSDARGPLSNALPPPLAQALDLLRGQDTVAEVAARLAPSEIAAAHHEGEAVAVVRTESGRLYMLPDRCPHDGGRISDGFVEGEQVVCARHGWEIDACSGRCERRGGASSGPSIALGTFPSPLLRASPDHSPLRASSRAMPNGRPANLGVLGAPQLVQLVPPRLRKLSRSEPPPSPDISGQAPRSDS